METAVKLGNIEIKDLAFLNDRSLLVLHISEGKDPRPLVSDLHLTIYRGKAFAAKHSLQSGTCRLILSTIYRS